jgi:hypothetical protein
VCLGCKAPRKRNNEVLGDRAVGGAV